MTPVEPYRQITRPPTDRFVVANGLNVHCLDWGGDGQPDLVFLHGAALTAHTWDTVCDLLRDEYRCLALDLRGHGDSDWAPVDGGYGSADFEADLEAAIEQLGLDRFVLIGMSLGGSVALGYAGTHGARLSGLVVVDTGPRDAKVPSTSQAQDADAERLASALPQGGWVRIEGAGHTVQGDRPHALAHELRAFLHEIHDGGTHEAWCVRHQH